MYAKVYIIFFHIDGNIQNISKQPEYYTNLDLEMIVMPMKVDRLTQLRISSVGNQIS